MVVSTVVWVENLCKSLNLWNQSIERQRKRTHREREGKKKRVYTMPPQSHKGVTNVPSLNYRYIEYKDKWTDGNWEVFNHMKTQFTLKIPKPQLSRVKNLKHKGSSWTTYKILRKKKWNKIERYKRSFPNHLNSW